MALLPLAVYSIGLAVGPIIAAPCSEMYGRLIVYRVALPACMLFTLGAGFSRSIEAFIVCRFFAAAAGGPIIPVGAGTNADLYGNRERATASCIYILAPFLGPSLA